MTAAISGRIARNGWKACPEKAVAFIRRRYPMKTAESVAADTGIGVETVKKWLDGSARPSWDGVFALICAYGNPFLIAVLPTPPEWVVEAARDEALRDLRAQQKRIDEQLRALGA